MKSSDNVIYCDNHLLVANKAAGMLTQPDGSSTPDLEGEMKAWVKAKYNKPGAVFLHAIHRLDRPVSGLVLFARTSKALSRLNEQVRSGTIERTYIAEVEGAPAEEEGDLEHYLRHGSHTAIVSHAKDPEAKWASLHYRIEKKKERTSLIRIELRTGRYHQIRAQFAAIGCPIVGDHRYGAKGEGKTIRLHCTRLALTHPVTQEALFWEELPLFVL